MIKTLALIFGTLFLAAGVLGFVPALTPNGHLFGLHVNAAHNMVHILSGIAAIACGLRSPGAARRFFQIFGIVYGLVAVLGFVYGDRPILGLIANNIPDAWFHSVVALASLIIGFVLKDEMVPRIRNSTA